MQKNELNEDQKYLPSHLLDDDDVPTATSLRNPHSQEREFAFSAPPILFNLGYRIQQDFFDDLKTWETPHYSTPQKLGKRDRSTEESEFEITVNSTRKLSLQNEEEYLSYQSYQSIAMPTINYFPTFSPQEEILANLAYASDWCKDQYGSRNIQTMLESGNQYLRNKIFDYLLLDLSELVYDKFGNYVIQKYIDIGSPQNQQAIYDFIRRELLFISLHSYGCRVVQKVVEFAQDKTQIQGQIMKEIEPHLMQIILNQNGNHIIQKVLEVFNKENTITLAKLILNSLEKLSFHPFGCRVVQKYLQNGRDQEISRLMLQQLIQMSIRLSKCQYGNYIMQFIVSHSREYELEVLRTLSQHFVDLSCNKFASNVIQKVIKSGAGRFNENVVDNLLVSQELITVAKNQFGNYVVQSLLQRSTKQRKSQLKTKLRENCHEISKSQYGRHVLMQMEKFK